MRYSRVKNPTNGGYSGSVRTDILYARVLPGGGGSSMSIQRVLVLSEQPVVSQGLKLIIENAGSAEVSIASDEATAASLISQLTPSIIVVDREDSDMDGDHPMLNDEYPSKLVVLSPNDDRMIVYSRQDVHEATLENLLGAIQEENLSKSD